MSLTTTTEKAPFPSLTPKTTALFDSSALRELLGQVEDPEDRALIAEWLVQGDDRRKDLLDLLEMTALLLKDIERDNYEPSLSYLTFKDLAQDEQLPQPPQFEPDRELIESLLKQAEPETDPTEALEPRKQAFLLSFHHHGSIAEAAKGVCLPASHYRWLEEDLDYSREFEHARLLAKDALLAKALRLATTGERSTVYYRDCRSEEFRDGKRRYVHTTKRSNQLLAFLLKNYDSLQPAARNTP